MKFILAATLSLLTLIPNAFSDENWNNKWEPCTENYIYSELLTTLKVKDRTKVGPGSPVLDWARAALNEPELSTGPQSRRLLQSFFTGFVIHLKKACVLDESLTARSLAIFVTNPYSEVSLVDVTDYIVANVSGKLEN